ncbi:MAG: hypothetical protein DRK00_03960 [Thermoprotei archaeon]|nr:MAG: hypothetical protein DRK00_03960 [Thermoprotei archaeon]
MPPWSIHAKYSARFMKKHGIKGIDPSLVDKLVDEPSSLLPSLRDVLEERDRLLALVLYDARLKPLDPLCTHDWGAWREGEASVEALRRIAETLWGIPGVLLVDLHLSLDYVWRGCEEEEFERWAENINVSREVREFVREIFEELRRERELWKGVDRAR